jgi:hypothetical protein
MARPDDWMDRTVIIGTDMYGGDTVGTLEVVEIESEIESEPVLQSIFYPWAKVNWMYHPEE